MSISSLITSVGQLAPQTIRPEVGLPQPGRVGSGLPKTSFEETLSERIHAQTDAVLHPQLASSTAPSTSVGKMVGGMIQDVQAAQNRAAQTTQRVLEGDGTALHQSMVAMEEASVSFQLLVEMRNKIVDSLQELMRMQV